MNNTKDKFKQMIQTLKTKKKISLLTFATFGEANNVCNAESQAYSNNEAVIWFEPYERENSKHNPGSCLQR
jgi:hypothetical protein